MDSLELTIFKKIFSNLSQRSKDEFVKEIETKLYTKLLNQTFEDFTHIKEEIKSPIFSLLMSDEKLKRTILLSANNDILKGLLLYKYVDEFLSIQNYKMRKFNVDDNISICLSLEEEYENDNIKWMDIWVPYSLKTISEMNIPLANWNFVSENKMKTVYEVFTIN